MTNLKLVLYGLIFALGAAIGWYGTHSYYALRIARQDAINQQNIIDAENAARQTEQHNNLLTEENSHELQSRLTAIDSQFTDLMQQTAASDNLPSVAGGQPGHSCATKPNQLSGRDKQFLVAWAKTADIQTQQLIACQVFLKQHGMAR